MKKENKFFLENHDFTVPLKAQFCLLPLSDKDRAIGLHLIDSLDNDGYLRRPLVDIADEFSFVNQFISETELQNILTIIKKLEPVGIGAANLKECLLLQLNAKKEKKQKTPT